MRKEISNVCVGALGDFRDFDELVGLHRNLFDGVEMIAMGGVRRIRTLLAQAEYLGYMVLTLHGRTMEPEHASTLTETLEARVYSTTIINTRDLVDVFSPRRDILVHAPIFRDPESYQLIRDHVRDIGVIWIENPLSGTEGLKEMFTVVRRIRIGESRLLRSSFILDMVWDYLSRWEEVYRRAREEMELFLTVCKKLVYYRGYFY